MGTGSSRSKVVKIDKGSQMPPVPDIKPSPSPFPSKSPKIVKSKPNQQRLSTQEDVFELDDNIEEYSIIWDPDTKLSSTFQQSSKSSLNKIEHHQKETFNKKWEKKSSTTFDSAYVESIIDTQIHSCINLSTSEKIDELINHLNQIHTQLDQSIKHRTEQISSETESVLSHILHETHHKQQRLINYAKQRQLKQDENYQKLLQEYISQLDEMKAKDLADLQNQSQIYRERILEESQLKIMTVNEQANTIKGKILREEQRQAAEKIDAVIAQIQRISIDEKLQHLGSEVVTKTSIISNSKVGTKAPGQTCTFDFNQNDSSEQRPQSNRKQILIHEEEQVRTRSITTQKSKR